jgi:hypothetical protein
MPPEPDSGHHPGPTTGPASGFAASRPSAFSPSQPPSSSPEGGTRTAGVRYRHRAHALATEREYRIGAHTLRWHDAARPDRGTGQLALRQIAALRIEVLGGAGPTRRCRLTLVPRGNGAPIVIHSDSAEGWLGRRAQPEAYRRFVRTLHAAALQAQPLLRVEAAPSPRLAGLGAPLLALISAAALGLAHGPLPALAGFALSWPLAALAARWHQARRAAPLPRGALPRHLLP